MRYARLVAAGLACLGWSANVWADRPGLPMERGESSQAEVFPAANGVVVKSVRGGYVWAISMVCTTAPCVMALYDSDTVGVGGRAIWEIAAGSNNESNVQSFPIPLVTTTGIRVNGTGTFVGFVEWE